MVEKTKKIRIPEIRLKPVCLPEIKIPKINLEEFDRIQASLRRLRRLRGI